MTETYAWVPEITGKNPVEAAREVVERKSARRVDGVLLDLTTAGAIVAVADALSPANREKLEGMSITRAADIVWKLVNR